MIEIQTIRTSDNQHMLYVEHIHSRWGFYITDGNRVWDGGIGRNMYRWKKAEISERLTNVKAYLEETREALLSGYKYPNFETCKLMYKTH